MSNLQQTIYMEIAKMIKKDLVFVQENCRKSLFGNPFNFTAEEVLYIYISLTRNKTLREHTMQLKPEDLVSIETLCEYLVK